MANEAYFAVSGYVATQPRKITTKDGTPTLAMRVAWTPRFMSKETGEWTDKETSFVSVTCYRSVAVNAGKSLRCGDPIVLRGTLKVREYTDQAGAKRTSVDVVADSLGHDLFRGTTHYTKAARHEHQTAEEYEATTAGRNPLPGDVASPGQASGALAGVPPSDEGLPDQPNDADYEPDDADYESDTSEPTDLPEPLTAVPDVEPSGVRGKRR